jgi:hypothetical protein
MPTNFRQLKTLPFAANLEQTDPDPSHVPDSSLRLVHNIEVLSGPHGVLSSNQLSSQSRLHSHARLT